MKTTLTIRRVLSNATAFVVIVAGSMIAHGQQGGSLADAARQARAQKQAQPEAQSQAQQLADELSEKQSDTGAPAGFKTYDTGDYKIWVPEPYHVGGHDAAGVVLDAQTVGVRRPVVLLGTPLVVHFDDSDTAFHDEALKFSHVYSDEVSCMKATVANHRAYQCSMAMATLLGKRVTGSAVLVRSGQNVYPLFCGTSADSNARDLVNKGGINWETRHDAELRLATEHDEIQDLMKKCDTVFQSIVIPEGPSVRKGGNQNVASGAPAIPPSVAAAAVKAPVAATPALQQSTDAVPASYKVHAFTYCKTQRDCFDASVLVPTGAKLLSSDCKQYIFEVKLQDQPYLLLAGTGNAEGCGKRSTADPSNVRWNELVAQESERAPGTSSTVSSLQSKVDGKNALITTMRFKSGLADWMGKRAEVETNGVSIVVGCMGPREHFPDNEQVCSALIDSLRLP